MVRHKLDSVSAFARRGYNLRITCDNAKCGHVVEANAVLLMQQLGATRAKMPIDRLEEKLKCSRCGHRGAAIAGCEINF